MRLFRSFGADFAFVQELPLPLIVHQSQRERVFAFLHAAHHSARGELRRNPLDRRLHIFCELREALPRAHVRQIGTQNVAASAEHMTRAAFGGTEKELSPNCDIARHFRISRFARQRPQERDNFARVGFGQRNGGHLCAGNAFDGVANQVFVGAAVLPLPASQIRPAPAFRIVAVTGGAILRKQARAFFDVVLWMLGQRDTGAIRQQEKSLIYFQNLVVAQMFA